MRIFIVIAALLTGFAGGWFFSPSDRTDTPQESRTSPGGRSVYRSAAERPAPADLPTGSIEQSLETAFASGRVGYPEMRALMSALAAMSPGNVDEFAAYFGKTKFERTQVMLWQMFLAAWGDFDPGGAIAFIDERFADEGARRLLYASVMETWKQDSFDDALQFAMEKFRPADTSIETHLALDYLRSLAKDDPDQAFALATKLNDGEFVMDMTAKRITELAKQDRNSALDAIDSLTGANHLHAASQFVIDWAQTEPAAAADWLATHYDDRYGKHVLSQVAQSYIKSDPDAAIKWIEALPDEQTRPAVLAEAMGEWARVDPAGVTNWLESATASSAIDPAVIAVSHQLAEENPKEVIENWIPKISDAHKGNELLVQVSAEWERSSPAEFAQWLDQTGAITSEVKQRLRQRETPGNGATETGNGGTLETSAGIDQGRDR